MQKSFTFLWVLFCLTIVSCSGAPPGSNEPLGNFKFTPDGEDAPDGGGDSYKDKSVPDPKLGPALEPLAEPPGDNESDLLPVGSLPGPALVPAGALNKTMIAAADKEGHVPAVGYPGAVDTKDENYDPDAKYQVIMTPKDKEFGRADVRMFGRQHVRMFGQNIPRPLWERVGERGWLAKFISSLIPQVVADPTPAAECSETLADSLDMDLDDAACCDVKKDGSFTCYYKDKEAEAVDYAKLESQEYCLYLTDGKDIAPFVIASAAKQSDQPSCEKPNKHALWLSQTSFDLSPYKSLSDDNGYTGFRVLAGPQPPRIPTSERPPVDVGTNIIGLHSIIPSPLAGEGQGEGGRLRVSGNFADSYREMTTNASELAFSFPSSPSWGEGQGEGGSAHTFALRRIVDPVFGVKEVCQQEGEFNFICEPLDFAKGDEQLEKYLKIKTTRDGQIWFSGRYQDITSKAYVYNLKDALDPTSKIYITDNDQPEGDPIMVSEILNFDVDENGYALAVFRDDKGVLKIRVGHEKPERRYGLQELPIKNVDDFKLYHVGSELTPDFKLKHIHNSLLLDSHNSKLYLVVDHEMNKKILLEGSITVGKAPTEMALNSESNKIFVINSGDATVTVVPLLNDTAEVLTVEQMEAQKKTFNLKDLFAGKSIPFKPEQIVYDDLGTTDNKDDRLIIGDKGLRSAVVLPTSVIVNSPSAIKSLLPVIASDSEAIPLKPLGEGLDPIKKVDFQKLFP